MGQRPVEDWFTYHKHNQLFVIQLYPLASK